ncbi:MAG: hypothetical protein MMC33_001611 [Icmadophila ericetorum]|nr:hypothetical protein [Icmadophila ericetorum]
MSNQGYYNQQPQYPQQAYRIPLRAGIFTPAKEQKEQAAWNRKEKKPEDAFFKIETDNAISNRYGGGYPQQQQQGYNNQGYPSQGYNQGPPPVRPFLRVLSAGLITTTRSGNT